jgi:hypothetical protein
MATGLKRFTISIEPSMETDLSAVREKYFCNVSQSEMLRRLIVCGLASAKGESGEVLFGPMQGT